jgi:membrane dipeptidase
MGWLFLTFKNTIFLCNRNLYFTLSNPIFIPMKNRIFPFTVIVVLFSSLFVFQVHAQSTDHDRSHHKALVIDTHTDAPMMLVEKYFDMGAKHTAPASRIDFPRLREGDVDAIFFGLFTSQRERVPERYEEAFSLVNRMIDSTNAAVSRYPDLVAIATSPGDILRISRTGRTAICLGMENGFPLAKDLSRIQTLYNRGVRYITLCHTSNNDICDSSTDKKGEEHNGLSDFGKQVVAEMNRMGMIIDVSHSSDKAFYDVLEISERPVMASHSSVRALCGHPRNMSDDMIRALAAKGGVIQICLLGEYIESPDTTTENYIKIEELRKTYNNFQFANDAERKAAWRAYDSIDQNFPPVLPGITKAVDHIDHVVKIAGIDHVGIGSDFDGGGGLADCADVADYPDITAELRRRGYSQKDINKIWGGNFVRVWGEVEATTTPPAPSGFAIHL